MGIVKYRFIKKYNEKMFFLCSYIKVRQGGMIGISLNTQWYEPFSNSSEDNYATQRARSFVYNW